MGYTGPALEVTAFRSGEDGRPGLHDAAGVFPFEAGVTRINPGLDRVLSAMTPGERRLVILPAEQAWGRSGLYTAETPGRRRFVISPNTMVVFEIEVIRPE
jgi:FKBP-type peptidyl-prolyl cis-trans isomerase